jgi:hypothetical protein
MFVQAVANALWPDEYTMKSYTICLITEEYVRPIAEMLLTRLTRSYNTAGGFCIDQAGKSMSSIRMKNISREEQEQAWKGCQDWIHKNTPYNDNMNTEIVRRQKLRQRQFMEEEDKEQALIDEWNAHRKVHARHVQTAQDDAQYNAQAPRELLLERLPEVLQSVDEEYAWMQHVQRIADQRNL